ncbi:MAG: bifunctional diaminohydroxyphosphoribosylaminopyrimidine deaminase/5-amino-6-(5-phosphoribosylamino)uracil reductase RibD [Alphaproteobacteria bacterium]
MISQNDIHHMRAAIALARTGLGRTAPNPSVGCIIVKQGRVLARARTADLGRPHAEALALEELVKTRGGHEATLYVTLEPCTHHGQTPPCTQAIIEARMKRVVIGTLDLNPLVSGRSISMLEDAGVQVDVMQGEIERECASLNEGFFSSIKKEAPRPYVTLKTACSLDGKIALASGESQWITGQRARRHAHFLRSRHDAVLVGIGTVLKDDPMLNTRLEGVDHNPIRIVMDSQLKTPIESALVKSAYARRLWVLHGKTEDDRQKSDAFLTSGVQTYEIDNIKDINYVLEFLAQKGITRLLVEGGALIHASFIRARAFDELVIYRAPSLLGEHAKNVSGDINVNTLAHRYSLQIIERKPLGEDVMERYKPITQSN